MKTKDPNYNPNVHPWKVYVVDKDGNEMQIRTYTKQEKAINYCVDRGNRGDKRLYRVKKVLI